MVASDGVKARDAIAEIPTIILTSSFSSQDRAECLELGANAYFTKASTLEQLDVIARQIHTLIAKGPQSNHREPPASGPAAGLAKFFMVVRSLAHKSASGVLSYR